MKKPLPIFQLYLQQNPCGSEWVGRENFLKIQMSHSTDFSVFPNFSLSKKKNIFIWQAGPSICLTPNFSNWHV